MKIFTNKTADGVEQYIGYDLGSEEETIIQGRFGDYLDELIEAEIKEKLIESDWIPPEEAIRLKERIRELEAELADMNSRAKERDR